MGWTLDISDESGDMTFYLCNKSAEKESIIAAIDLRGKMKSSRTGEIRRVFEPNQSWGYKSFFKKETLDNHMKNVVGAGGHLNIHLKITCEYQLL